MRSTQRAIGMMSQGSRVANPPPTAIANRRYQGRKRGILRATPLEVLAGDLEVLRAHDAVDESEGELESARVLEHAGEALGARVGLGRLALGEPLPHEGLDLVDGGQVCEDILGWARTGPSLRPPDALAKAMFHARYRSG